MRTERLDAAIKTRVPRRDRESIQRIAEARHLDMADIVRQAIREYLARERSSAQASAAEV